MKILLIQARTENPEGPIFPLGLGYLASSLPRDLPVQAVDMNVEEDPYQKIENVGKTFRPDIIALSVRNIKVAKPGEHISSGRELQEMAQRIKSLVPEATIVAGGAGFSLYSEPLMESIPGIDFAVVGEGEYAFRAMVEKFPKPVGIKGVVHRNGAELVFEGNSVRPDFAKLPWPRRDIFKMEVYKKHPTSVGVMTKRGCPYRCVHCSDIYLLGRRMRLREPEDVVAELKHLREEYDVTQFMFADQTFNVPVDYTKVLLRQMVDADLGMRWTAYFTPEGLDEEMVDLFRRSGCYLLNFSPDCCDDAMLRRLRKGFLMKDLYRANVIAKKIGIPITYNFMMGLPGETLLALLHTLIFTVMTKIQLRKLFQLHGLFIVPVRIYPHTKLKEMAVEDNLIDASDDLLQPRFYRSKNTLVNIADRVIFTAISLLWKIKHKSFH
jgi:radical SAM superfamily enzyme YgiQ (UPF0313 family)